MVFLPGILALKRGPKLYAKENCMLVVLVRCHSIAVTVQNIHVSCPIKGLFEFAVSKHTILKITISKRDFKNTIKYLVKSRFGL